MAINDEGTKDVRHTSLRKMQEEEGNDRPIDNNRFKSQKEEESCSRCEAWVRMNGGRQ